MTILVYSKSLIAGTPENLNDVASNFLDVKTVLNGNVDATNLTAASVTDSRLTSPNNSVYKTLLTASTNLRNSVPNGTFFLAAGSNVTAASDIAQSSAIPIIYFVAADYLVGGLTQKLRIRAQVSTNATASSSIYTIGLYPVTFSGGAGSLSVTPGSTVAGSGAVFNTVAASTTTSATSGDFTIPADGPYMLACSLSGSTGNLTPNNVSLLTAQLMTRNV